MSYRIVLYYIVGAGVGAAEREVRREVRREGCALSEADSQQPPRGPSGQATFQHVAREALPSDLKQYWLLTNEERVQLAHLSARYPGPVA